MTFVGNLNEAINYLGIKKVFLLLNKRHRHNLEKKPDQIYITNKLILVIES
jgi:hypothetical protein